MFELLRGHLVRLVWIVCWAGVFGSGSRAVQGAVTSYVIAISVDGGGGGYIQNLINSNQLPNFKLFQTQGSFTNNARTDYDYTITLPNHTSMLTGRRVTTSAGHEWTTNVDPPASATLHNNKNPESYVASVFDVVHDYGLRTGVYVSKSKFSIYDTSYNGSNGAVDLVGADNGKDKIDTYVYDPNVTTMTSSYIAAMNSNPFKFSFLHFANTDNAGHASGWGSAAYNSAMIDVDTQLGLLFNMVNNNPTLKNKTTILLTADHGGTGTDHSNITLAVDYTIPFYAWGANVAIGGDLYGLNSLTRLDPGTGRPDYSGALQPIRNGDLANLSLDLLDLPPVPGSTIGFSQNLALPEPSTWILAVTGMGAVLLCFRRRK